MVRLVVLVVGISFLTACSGILNSVKHDPRNQQSEELQNEGSEKIQIQHADILRLDEGKHHPAVQVLLTQAEDARQQGQHQQALSYLDRARQIQPRNSAIFYRQAWLNYRLGELPQAQQLLQRARLFLRSTHVSYKTLQHRIKTLQKKVDAKRGY